MNQIDTIFVLLAFAFALLSAVLGATLATRKSRKLAATQRVCHQQVQNHLKQELSRSRGVGIEHIKTIEQLRTRVVWLEEGSAAHALTDADRVTLMLAARLLGRAGDEFDQRGSNKQNQARNAQLALQEITDRLKPATTETAPALQVVA